MQQENIEIDPIRDVKFIFALMSIMFWFFSKPVEVFIRSDYGERHLKLGSIYFTFIILNVILLFSVDVSKGLGENFGISVPLATFSYLFLAMGFFHGIVIIIRNFKGNYSVMSFHRGNSIALLHWIFKPTGFFNRLLPNFVSRIVDPVLVFFVGGIAMVYDPTLGVFIQFCSVCLFFDEHINWMHARSRFLDHNDGRLRSEFDKEQDKLISQTEAKMTSHSVIPPVNQVASGGNSTPVNKQFVAG